MADGTRLRPFLRTVATALVVGMLSIACCPVPAGSAATAFTATVASVDDHGYWAVSADGTRWRVERHASPSPGERVYLEGVWTNEGVLRIDRATRLQDR